MDLLKLKYPVFRLGECIKVWEERKILYAQTRTRIGIVDNKNLAGDTLGRRRLRIPSGDLHKLRQPIYSIKGLLNKPCSSGFIDKYGLYFTHKKVVWAKLITTAITKRLPVDRGMYIETTFSPAPIFSYIVNETAPFIQLLVLGDNILFWGFSMEYKKPTKKFV